MQDFLRQATTSDHDLFSSVTRAAPERRSKSAKGKRERRQKRVIGRAVEGLRTSRDQELRAALATIEDLRQQLTKAEDNAAVAESKAKQARLDLVASRTLHRLRKRFDRKIHAEEVSAACALAVQKECELLQNRVTALNAQADADAARRRADRAKFAADETLHLQTADRLRRERHHLRLSCAQLQQREQEQRERDGAKRARLSFPQP